jgi:hypothetical protein
MGRRRIMDRCSAEVEKLMQAPPGSLKKAAFCDFILSQSVHFIKRRGELFQ